MVFLAAFFECLQCLGVWLSLSQLSFFSICWVTGLGVHPGASREHREPSLPKQCLGFGGMPRLFALPSSGTRGHLLF